MYTPTIATLQHEVSTSTRLIDALEAAANTALTEIVESISSKLDVLKKRRAWLLGEIQRLEDGIPF